MPNETYETDKIDERKAELQELREEWRRRLHKRKLQQARLGVQTDPAISNEIEDLERTVANLDRQIAAVPTVITCKKRPRIDFFEPRFPVTIKEWQYHIQYLLNREFGNPPGYLCYVEPGIYQIGNWKPGDPFESVELDGFWAAKHPITVRQYQRFIEAGGYNNKGDWTPNGWEWRRDTNRTQPYGWGEERFSRPDQPVIGVSWYEATAFAAWLNRQLARVLPYGYSVRLPTEAEWEVAAAYDVAMASDVEIQRRIFPWGDSPEPSCVLADFNTRDELGGPTPVGERPDGATACGAQDMVGSVWEATTSSFDTYPTHSNRLVADFELGCWDVPYRGGSWRKNSASVRCGSRDWYDPHFGDDDWGFRVCLSSDIIPDF